jgi:hypothetical protein
VNLKRRVRQNLEEAIAELKFRELLALQKVDVIVCEAFREQESSNFGGCTLALLVLVLDVLERTVYADYVAVGQMIDHTSKLLYALGVFI